MPIYYARFDSPAGPLLGAVGDAGLRLLEFSRGLDDATAAAQALRVRHALRVRSETDIVESPSQLAPCICQLQEYFSGNRREFTIPLDLRGTEFQLRCWRALLKIPYGETRNYAELARTVGSPNACRAAGAANGANPIVIIVPCHRVVASNGTLGGYGGGLELKEKLLRLEGAAIFVKPQKELAFLSS